MGGEIGGVGETSLRVLLPQLEQGRWVSLGRLPSLRKRERARPRGGTFQEAATSIICCGETMYWGC